MNSEQIKKLKLNKGEKRALKFLLKRQMDGEQGLDINKVIQTSDIAQLKQMLAVETKKMSESKTYVATGGGSKHKVKGVNSNKLIDYQKFINDDSD